MNTKIKYGFLLALVFLITSVFSQKAPHKITTDSGTVYLGFYTGGTTMAIAYYSNRIDSMPNVTKKPMSKPYLDTLSLILSNVKAQRHYQQKIGPARYSKIYVQGTPRKLAFFSGWTILDYTNRRIYQTVVRGTKYEEMLRRFVENNWNK